MGIHRQRRILNVEDDAPVALLERKAFEAAGYQVDDALDGGTALRLLEEQKYDAIVLDYRLPDMTGRAFVGRLHGRDRLIPVIVVTAYGDERLAVELLKEGVVDYMDKDISMAFVRTLPGKVDAMLRR